MYFVRQVGDEVVRFIDNHQRAMQLEQVGERGQRLRGAGKVRLQVLVMLIDLAARCVLDTQGSGGGNDDAYLRPDVRRADLREISHVEHGDLAFEGVVQFLPVGVARVAEGLQRLRLDLRGRHHPQHQRELAL